ncbi:MAG: gamma carbonic anhydrase family protein [Deinococcus sp.]|nr:gamma carbonic anhydrase family protein [Deinococcus sp.]
MLPQPKIHPSAFVAPGAHLIGAVELGEQVSIWPGAVLRADLCYIKIGRFSNVQDNAVLHVDDNQPTILGEYVTVGHGAVVHACILEDEVLIGINAVVLNKVLVERGAVIAAGAVVPPGRVIPAGMLAMGVPAQVVGPTKANGKRNALRYLDLIKLYRP